MTKLASGIAIMAAVFAFEGSIAHAADIAAFQPIGFSRDGNLFAFEEYGIQDGSGFPYSDIFVIDTVHDRYAPGTPIRVRIDDEGAGLTAARQQSGEKAEPLLAQYRFTDHAGQLVAFNPASEAGADPHRLRYLAYPADPPFGKPYALELDEFAQEAPPKCKDIVAEVKRFRLVLALKDGAPVNDVIHEDASVPESRGCPVGYRLGGAMTYFVPETAEIIHMALVMVLSYGFEGNDGRWIAIPVRP